MMDLFAALIAIAIIWHVLMGIGMACGAFIYAIKVDIWDMWRFERRMDKYKKW